jgi:hypothetical protein
MLLKQLQELQNTQSCSELQALINESGYENDDQVDDVFLEHVIGTLAHRLEVMTRTADKLAELFEECLSVRIEIRRHENVARVRLRDKEMLENSFKRLEQSSVLLKYSKPTVFVGSAMQHGHLRVMK